MDPEQPSRSKSKYVSEGDVESDDSDNSPSRYELQELDNPSLVGEDHDGLEARVQGGVCAPRPTKKFDSEAHEDNSMEREDRLYPTIRHSTCLQKYYEIC